MLADAAAATVFAPVSLPLVLAEAVGSVGSTHCNSLRTKFIQLVCHAPSVQARPFSKEQLKLSHSLAAIPTLSYLYQLQYMYSNTYIYIYICWYVDVSMYVYMHVCMYVYRCIFFAFLYFYVCVFVRVLLLALRHACLRGLEGNSIQL